MKQQLLRFVSQFFPAKAIFAHCDVPCGIYDPHQAQLAAHTILRMTSMIMDLQASSETAPFDEQKRIMHQIARLTKVKEDHAELLKHEIRIIWGDYFKEEHLNQYPHLHELVFQIMKLASKARQEINKKAAEQLLAKVQEFAEIFFKTKNLEPVRVKAPYPTGGEIVLHT